MKKSICIVFLLFLIIGVVSACKTDASQTLKSTSTHMWQDAYAELLREYEEENSQMFFLLYDFDKDKIPELIITGTNANEVFVTVFAFRDDNLLSLEYGDDVPMADFFLSARSGIMPPPNDAPGLILYKIGPSAGAYGTSDYYSKIIIDENRLIIIDRGMKYIDVEALNKLFDDFGRNATDVEALTAAIENNTHYYINDDVVSKEKLSLLFGNVNENDELQQLAILSITESNIRELIYAWIQ